MGEFVRVAALADVKPGHGIVAEGNGKALAVFNVDGTIHAINNTWARLAVQRDHRGVYE